MPTYAYHCEKCGERFERSERMAQHESSKPRCPKCKSPKVQQDMTPFYARTARKS